MKRSILLFLLISGLHYVAQFFFWGLAEFVPSKSTEAIRTIGVMGTEILFIPIKHIPSEWVYMNGFDLFPLLTAANSLLWGFVGTVIFTRLTSTKK